MICGKLVENNSPKTTRRKQLGRKISRKNSSRINSAKIKEMQTIRTIKKYQLRTNTTSEHVSGKLNNWCQLFEFSSTQLKIEITLMLEQSLTEENERSSIDYFEETRIGRAKIGNMRGRTEFALAW